MPRHAHLLNAFTRGCLDPDLGDRYDLSHYYLALADATNQVALVQGGLKRRGGTIVKNSQRLRRMLEPVKLTAGMIITHNGGTPLNIVDQDATTLFTTSAVALPLFAAVEIDLGAAVPVCFVDVINFQSGSVGANRILAVEYFDGSVWVAMPGSSDPTLSALRGISSTASRTRRFGGAPGSVFSARNWRVMVYNGVGAGTISIEQLRFWREGTSVSKVKLIPSAKQTIQSYICVLTHRNVDVFRNGLFMASIPVAVDPAMLPDVNREQSRDTLLLFHEDLETPIIIRQGSHDEWNVSPIAPSNVPALTSGSSFAGSQDETQEVVFTALTPGDSFFIMLGELVAGPVTYTTSAQMLVDVKAALVLLPGVTTDLTITAPSAGGVGFRAAFTLTNGSRTWPRFEAIPMVPSAASAATTIIQPGLLAGAPLFGRTTGFARCGIFIQKRLAMFGFRSAPTSYLISRTGSQYDFQTTGSPLTADLGVFNTIDSDQVETIYDVTVGTHITLFTELGEWWFDLRTVDATQPLNMVSATRYGIARGIVPVMVQNALTFIQAGGDLEGVRGVARVARDFTYQYTLQNYSAEPLSLLGGHLLKDVVDLVHRPGSTQKDASLLLFINRDGSAAMMTLLRSQEVTAITPCSTDGFIRAGTVDVSRNLWWVVERATSARSDNYLERMDENTLLDGAITISSQAPVLTVTGLGHHEGKTVYAYGDDNLQGPFTVAGGTITLTAPASAITVGRLFQLAGKTLPLREKLQMGEPFRPPVRIPMVEWSVRDCGPFEMRVNGGDWTWVRFQHMDNLVPDLEAAGTEPLTDLLDASTLSRLYSGYLREEGLLGWSRHGVIEWRQALPLPFKMLSIRSEAVY